MSFDRNNLHIERIDRPDTPSDNPFDQVYQTMRDGYYDHAFQRRGLKRDPENGCLFALKNQKGQVKGGIFGSIAFKMCFLQLLWVDSEYRGQGYGKQLVQNIEDFGRNRGCKAIYLDTMDWEAPDFYKKLGYRIDCSREVDNGLEKPSSWYQMSKKL